MSYCNLLKLNDVNGLITVIPFLTFRDTKNLLLSCKDVYKNKYIKIELKKQIGYLIISIFRRYIPLIRDIRKYNEEDIIHSKRLNAVYFYRFYDKKYINSWYNLNGWKKDIINRCKKRMNNHFLLEIKQRYKDIHTTRLDLFNIIRNMEVRDALAIGW